MAVFTTAARTWVAAEILTASNLNGQLRDFINGFTASSAYTPAWTSTGTAPALGNGTLTGKHTQIGKHVLFKITLTTGSTTTYGTGTYSLSLPVGSAGAAGEPHGSAKLLDSSASASYLGVPFLATGTTVQVLTQSAAGASASVAQTSPFTWATGDQLIISGVFEAS